MDGRRKPVHQGTLNVLASSRLGRSTIGLLVSAGLLGLLVACSASVPVLPFSGSPKSSTTPQGSTSHGSATQDSIPGWQLQRSTTYGYSYEVPAGWKVENPDTAVSYEASNGQMSGSLTGASSYREGFCQGNGASSRATTGFAGSNGTDLATLAANQAKEWATAAYAGPSAPTVAGGPAKPITIAGLQAQEATATITVHSNESCAPPNAVVYAVALPGRSGGPAVSFVIVSDQGVADAASTSDLQQIVASLRPS